MYWEIGGDRLRHNDSVDKFSFSSARFLVAGCAGFLGSHLCESLLEQGASVIGIDSYLTGCFENIRPFFSNPLFEFLEQDICDPLQIEGGLGGIFHLASPASPIHYGRYPIKTLQTGSIGTYHLLELAKQKKCPILVASTSEVYGDPLCHPQEESYFGNVNPIGLRSCYDEAKRFLEAITMAYHREHGMSTRIARIFNTYGPRMQVEDGRVVSNFCVQALRGEPLTIYGSGRQTRSFCYVSDLIRGLIALFLSNEVLPVNLGNPVETTVLELSKLVGELTNTHVALSRLSLPEDDPKQRCPNIERAKTLLDWEPQVGLRDGLKKTIEYFTMQVVLLGKQRHQEK